MFDKAISVITQKLGSESFEAKQYSNFLIASEKSGIEYPFFAEEVFYILCDEYYNPDELSAELTVELTKTAFDVAMLLNSFNASSINLSYYYKICQNKIYYIKAFAGDRVATKLEVENHVDGLLEYTLYSMNQTIANYIRVLLWASIGKREIYSELEVGKFTYNFDYKIPSEVLDNLLRVWDILLGAIQWAKSPQFKKDLATLRNNKKQFLNFEYLDYAEDEIVGGAPFSSIIEYIAVVMENDKSSNPKSSYTEMILSIVKHYKMCHKVSKRQEEIIRALYNKIVNAPSALVESDNVYLNRIEKILSFNKEEAVLTPWEIGFVHSIRNRKSYGKLTDKQKRVINSIYANINPDAFTEFTELKEPQSVIPERGTQKEQKDSATTKTARDNRTEKGVAIPSELLSLEGSLPDVSDNPWDEPRLANPLTNTPESSLDDSGDSDYPESFYEEDDYYGYDSVLVID